ncbi:MAG: SDR family oxidoreductase [Opitutaceae bacterium]|nr:SDR family oxidoreductase [Opitutaceae bacterium]
MNLSHEVCVVTGAAKGIGLALVSALTATGAKVVACDIDGAALASAAGAFNAKRVLPVTASVALPSDMVRLVRETERAFGAPSVWINNAGLARHRAIVDYTADEIDLMLDVNLKGAILGSQAAFRSMQPQRRGHIVNIISTASLRGIPTETVYCAAKWGVRGFTQGLREEAAAFGIRVTAVLPGGVDTGFWRDAVSRQMPVEKFLSAKHVADAVVSLLQMDDRIVPQELVLRAMEDRDFAT